MRAGFAMATLLPGGYTEGDQVYFTGPSQTISGSSDLLWHGEQGEVRGAGTRIDGKDMLLVQFPENTGWTNCCLTMVRPCAASAAALRLRPNTIDPNTIALTPAPPPSTRPQHLHCTAACARHIPCRRGQLT